MRAHYRRADVLYRQGRYEQAERELREQMVETPDDGWTHAFLGRCLAQQNMLPEAVEEGEEAVRLAPDLPYAHHVLGETYSYCDRLEDAEAALREALRLAPREADHLEWLSWVQYRRGKTKTALATVNRGLEIDPEHIGCLNRRGHYQRWLGDRRGSELTLRAVLALEPEHAYAHANLGWTLCSKAHAKANRLGVARPFALACCRELGEALGHFHESLRLHPGWEWPRSGVAYVLLARRRALVRLLAAVLAVVVIVLWSFWPRPVSPGRPAAGLSDPHNMGLAFVLTGLGLAALTNGPLYALLRANRLGWAVLTARQRQAAATTVCLIAALPGVALAGWLAPPPTGFAVLFYILAMIGPLTGACEATPGGARRFVTGYALLLGAAGLACLFAIARNDRDVQSAAVSPLWLGLALGSWKTTAVARTAEEHFAKKAG